MSVMCDDGLPATWGNNRNIYVDKALVQASKRNLTSELVPPAYSQAVINYSMILKPTKVLQRKDCAKHFKGVKSHAYGEEIEKSFTKLLVEELKQREEEATQAQQEADVKLLEAKKIASQYQKEADKCSSSMDNLWRS